MRVVTLYAHVATEDADELLLVLMAYDREYLLS